MIGSIINKYFEYLQSSNYNKIIRLFSKNAIVVSPLYGDKLASVFYKELFEDTSNSKILLKNIFLSNNPNIGAAHFIYEWSMLDNSKTLFECIDVFEFDENKEINKLTIIYDTFHTRKNFNQVKNI